MPSLPSLEKLQAPLLAKEIAPIGARMRAAYYLKQAYGLLKKQQEEATSADSSASLETQRDSILSTLSTALLESKHGSLLRHEVAYVLGQIGDTAALPVLTQCLQLAGDCSMVRHECAEAMAAIASGLDVGQSKNRTDLATTREILQQVVKQYVQEQTESSTEADSAVPIELKETCDLAVAVLQWKESGGDPGEAPPPVCACMIPAFSTTDPAPPHPAHAALSEEELGAILNDTAATLWDRYRALFSLRNRGTPAAVEAIGQCLVLDASSALLRHECAYVLGQLQKPASRQALTDKLVVGDPVVKDHMMVRHECAEALGALLDSPDIDMDDYRTIEGLLKVMSTDENEPLAVRESCLVALDAADYWNTYSNNSAVDEDGVATTTTFSQAKGEQQQTIGFMAAQHYNRVEATPTAS